jgi:hypothetical protein
MDCIAPAQHIYFATHLRGATHSGTAQPIRVALAAHDEGASVDPFGAVVHSAPA